MQNVKYFQAKKSKVKLKKLRLIKRATSRNFASAEAATGVVL